MTSCDLYELGRELFHAEDYTNSVVWMFEALRKYKEEKPLTPRYITSIIEYIRISLGKLGRFVLCIKFYYSFVTNCYFSVIKDRL